MVFSKKRKSERFSTDAMKESLGMHDEPTRPTTVNLAAVSGDIKRMKNAQVIEVSKIEPDPEQPRKHFDEGELNRLAESLREHGQLQPISVLLDRSSEERKYIIISGERRWRAAKIANLETLNAVVEKRRLSQEELRIRQYAENAVRDDFAPIDLALFYKKMQEETGASLRELAPKLLTSAAKMSRTMKLLAFPDDIQQQINDRVVPHTVAYEVLKIEGEEQQREYIANFLAGHTTTEEISAQSTPQTGGRPQKTKKPKTKKTVTIRGLKIDLSSKEKLTQAEIVDRLEELIDRYRNDKRGAKSRAA